MLSYLAHYMNKYPDGTVDVLDKDIIVYCRDGKKRVHIQKNGVGMWTDVSEKHACTDRHDLAPIPKEARAWKHYGTHVGKSEEYDERIELSRRMASHELGGPGKVPSLPEIEQYLKLEKKQRSDLLDHVPAAIEKKTTVSEILASSLSQGEKGSDSLSQLDPHSSLQPESLAIPKAL